MYGKKHPKDTIDKMKASWASKSEEELAIMHDKLSK